MTPNPQDSAVALEVERAKFEAWAKENGRIFLDRQPNQNYMHAFTQEAWVGWKARASQSDGTSGGWRPIETAPKDGSEFLAVYGHQGNVMQIVRYNYLHGFWQIKGEPEIGFTSNATRWMPLPAAQIKERTMSDDNKEGAGVPVAVVGKGNGGGVGITYLPALYSLPHGTKLYATPPAAMPAAPSGAVTDGTSFLIQICGEDIDHPLTAIVPNWEGVRRFCVEHYTGSEDAENLCGNILDTLKTEFDEHEAEETGKPYIEQWEIGGLSIERVCDCTPRAALKGMQPGERKEGAE